MGVGCLRGDEQVTSSGAFGPSRWGMQSAPLLSQSLTPTLHLCPPSHRQSLEEGSTKERDVLLGPGQVVVGQGADLTALGIAPRQVERRGWGLCGGADHREKGLCAMPSGACTPVSVRPKGNPAALPSKQDEGGDEEDGEDMEEL